MENTPIPDGDHVRDAKVDPVDLPGKYSEEYQTRGEHIVRTKFNVAPKEIGDKVDMIKKQFAGLINLLESDAEKDYRLHAKAVDAIEVAAMYATKLVTA